jgi:PAS domain S-box-containing protein
LSTVVAVLAGLGLVQAFAGPPDPLGLGGFPHLILPWTAALLALLVAAFAWASWVARGGTALLLLGSILPALALLGLHGSLSAWKAATGLQPDGAAGPPLWRAAGNAAVLGLLLLALIPMAHLHRREPGLMTHAMLLSLMPLAAAQLAALASVSPFDGAALAAHGETALASLTLLAGVVLDFLGTKEANERYLHRLQLLELAVQRMSLGLTITDPAGEILFVNAADAAMHGYKPDELVGQRSRIFGQEDAGPAERPEVPAFWRRESLNRTRDGRLFPVRLISDTVLDEEGRPRAFVTLCEDVSEARRTQERVERLKRDFLATVSHELRTPITSILGALGLLRDTRLGEQPERIQELLEIADRNGNRLLLLVNDLLDLQRLEEEAMTFRMAPLRLGTFLDDTARGLAGFAELYKVRLRVETGSPDSSLVSDRDRLAQVLYNLLSNAVKFSPAGQEVLLAGRVEDGQVEIVVRDHGPGIPAEFRSRLFENFAQAEDPQTRRQGGSGLGLAISKKLIDGLGGTIAIASAPGAGTTVTVRLPRR